MHKYFAVSKWLVRLFLTALFIVTLIVTGVSSASAHGFAGKRFFPTTLNIDDPFVNDELSLLFNHIKESSPEGASARVSTLTADYGKTITKHLGISIGGAFINRNPQTGDTATGFDNIDIGVKYQFLTNGVHETIISIGSGFSLANTGDARVGAESVTVFSPTIFVGKGFGDLPDSMNALKPLAITGVFGGQIPSRRSTITATGIEHNPSFLSWGFTVQYSLHYLQSYVKDVGLPAPFDRMMPIVEFAFDSGLNRGDKRTTGTVNPGILWSGKSMQLGIEAQIPINSQSGNNVGVMMLLHFYIDDLFPGTFGKPLFNFR